MSTRASQARDVLAGADPEQARLMAEQVILVDGKDNVIGRMSKRDAHLVKNDLPLHRAFSVLLFDTEGRMLLQQRADAKVTFPAYWTNTVCSHPLYLPSELGEEDKGDAVFGAKRAAIRKLSHELGVSPGAVTSTDLTFMTRILYRSECSDGVWGERELDYIFLIQKNVPLKPEKNEVQQVRYVTKPELEEMFYEAKTSEKLKMTPWFTIIMERFVWPWWDVILRDGLSRLGELQDQRIHRFTG
ncbi:Isopentenyl-diphosphate Delta-isomerase 1 [Gracilariopsis chorda]|uniref:isopentenyl-diphosphate Delta-isomerase n=1 Tax=Gracilariopsis chorda TaxID=448386 RepID=A0A2V3J3D8_9FLOR|nr:Isopentenyl-diphosphate Delta-isomerase 1 [Gracilariopsis chorda]|eukprot:PXF48889.1 Isopentenyl-diphosphate Delta-isomerase 1 [Gracilariopsis chorda]